PAPGATELGLSGGRDARFGGKQSRAEGSAGRVVFVRSRSVSGIRRRARIYAEAAAPRGQLRSCLSPAAHREADRPDDLPDAHRRASQGDSTARLGAVTG